LLGGLGQPQQHCQWQQQQGQDDGCHGWDL
jgi:hypothetical protein